MHDSEVVLERGYHAKVFVEDQEGDGETEHCNDEDDHERDHILADLDDQLNQDSCGLEHSQVRKSSEPGEEVDCGKQVKLEFMTHQSMFFLSDPGEEIYGQEDQSDEVENVPETCEVLQFVDISL